MRKIIAVVIVAAMISVSFAIITPQTAKAEFIEELVGGPWGTTFTPLDVVFDDGGHYCVMVGHESDSITAGLSNAWGYDVFSDSWYALNGAPRDQILKSVCYSTAQAKFMLCGDMGGGASNSVYYIDKGNTILLGMGHSVASSAIACDGAGNVLVGGSGGSLHSYDGGSWYPYSPGSQYDFTSITFNTGDQRFYLTAYDNGVGAGTLFYTDTAPLNGASIITFSDPGMLIPDLSSIEWNQGKNYGLAVGYGVYRVEAYQGGPNLEVTVIDEYSTENIFYDVAWDSDGWNEAAIFGRNNTELRGVYFRYYDSNPTMIFGHLDSVASSIYRCGCFKPPASPKMVFAPTPMGGIIAHVDVNDQSTVITANAMFPKLWWIGFNDSAMNNRLDQQVAPDADYYFTLCGNYSDGWNNTEVVIEAWYDHGIVQNASAYPAETDENRTLAFRVNYTVWSGWFEVQYPAGAPNEVTNSTGVVNQIEHWDHPDGDQANRTLEIPVWLGPQTRAANGTGFSADPDFHGLKNQALQDAFSWDFSITLRDCNLTTAANTSYGEFGIEQAVSISVAGNPTGNAPPGSSGNILNPTSQITYSANTNHWVNVSIPNLYLGGDTGSAYWIPTDDVSVMNINGNANATNTYIIIPTYFPSTQNVSMNVWGLNATGIGPNGNGTTSMGPILTNYNSPGTFTELQWWVDVQAGTPEGIYWAAITINIDGY